MKTPSWLPSLVFVGFVGSILYAAAFMAAAALPVQDLAQYWSAAHLVGQNPYSSKLVADLEHSSGIFIDTPLVLKNPPWAIPFILPLGLFSYRVDFALWTVFSVMVVLFCARSIWRELKLPDSLVPVVLPLVFGPTIVQLMLGQWTVLVLPGLTIFLIAVGRRQDWLAGASLLLLLGKPHLTLLFLLAVALWVIREKRWTVFLSGFLAFVAANLIIGLINPRIFGQFWERTGQVVQETYVYPNMGGLLFLISGKHALALLPQFAGLIWLAFYWKTHRQNWNWWDHGMFVILCSILFSYYSYPYDEILALPALLIAFASGNRRRFLVAFTLTNLGYFIYISGLAGRLGFDFMFLWWTSLGWLISVWLAHSQGFRYPSDHLARDVEILDPRPDSK